MAEPHVVPCYWCTRPTPISMVRGLSHAVTHEWLWFCDACPSISICCVVTGGGDIGADITPSRYNQRLTISPRQRQDVQGLCIMDAGGGLLYHVRGMRRVTEGEANECHFMGVVVGNNTNIEWFIDPTQRETYNRMLRELLS